MSMRSKRPAPTASPAAVGTICPDTSCGHPRTHHSRNGCTRCSCPLTWMDLSPGKQS